MAAEWIGARLLCLRLGDYREPLRSTALRAPALPAQLGLGGGREERAEGA
jgi:hypothetical protein